MTKKKTMTMSKEAIDQLAMEIACSMVKELGEACAGIAVRHVAQFDLEPSTADRIMAQVFLSFLVGSYYEDKDYEDKDKRRSLDDLLTHIKAGWHALEVAHEGSASQRFVH